jgi:hypothetical protein
LSIATCKGSVSERADLMFPCMPLVLGMVSKIEFDAVRLHAPEPLLRLQDDGGTTGLRRRPEAGIQSRGETQQPWLTHCRLCREGSARLRPELRWASHWGL